MESELNVSLVIACYNEEGHLRESISQIQKVMAATRYSYEIIFVDDASRDTTRSIIAQLCANKSGMRYIFHEKNLGRGSAVMDGIRQAQGAIVGFIDIDLETHARYIPWVVAEIEEGSDVACAWRIYKTRLDSLDRWIYNRGYNFLVRTYLGLEFRDTETGCKFFRREKILPVLDEVVDRHWFWDTEIIARAHLKGLKIAEVPTLYVRRHDKKSTVKVFSDVFYYFKKLVWFKREIEKLKQGNRGK